MKEFWCEWGARLQIQLTLEQLRDANPLGSWESIRNFWLLQNWTTNSLIDRSLTNNIYSWENKMLKNKEEKIHLLFAVLYLLILLSLHRLFTRWMVCQYLHEHCLYKIQNTIGVTQITNTTHQNWKDNVVIIQIYLQV